VVFSSYCYSDTIYGSTNNAAITGPTWAMTDVLPDYSAPHITVVVNGLIYQYTANKDPEADMLVHVYNEDAINGGYIFSETDNWSGVPGNTIRKVFTFPNINAEVWGPGGMTVEGDGSISDPSMVYTYRMDIGEAPIQCRIPLADPSCPGFLEALLQYLKDNELLELSPDDPYYDEWVQAELEKEAELEEEDSKAEEKDEEQLEAQLSVRGGDMEGLVDASQQNAIMAELAAVPTFDSYYETTIPGGMYEDSLVLVDSELPDNRRAMRSLASDAAHRQMVRSQYE